MRDQRSVAVWDLPTRVFKWALVVCVITAFLLSSQHPRGLLFLIHVSCGYAVTLLLLFRFTWGLIGSEYARFRSFVRGWPSVSAHLQGLLRLHPPRTAGHNPLGGWMIMLMLITLCALVLTGLLAEGKTGGAGALSTILSPARAKLVGNLHAWLGFAIIWLAAVHVAGVVTESLLQRENLIVAMITGRKLAPDITITDEHQVSAWRAVPVALVLVILGAWLAWRTHLAPP